MTEEPIEHLNLLDTDYAEILSNSCNPNFELKLVSLGVDREEARLKTRFITLLQKRPLTPEAWEELLTAWEQACGDRPNADQLHLISKMIWDQDSLEDWQEAD